MILYPTPQSIPADQPLQFPPGPPPSVWFGLLAVPAGLGITLLALFAAGWNGGTLVMLDVNAIGARPAYYGIGAIFGYLLWGATAAICLFGGFTLLGLGRAAGGALLLAIAALVSLILADDVLMLHERLPAAAELIVFMIYGAFALGTLYHWREVIRQHEPILLVAAMALLGSSVLIDVVLPYELRWSVILEDTVKLCGQTLWLGYFARLAWREIVRSIRQTPNR